MTPQTDGRGTSRYIITTDSGERLELDEADLTERFIAAEVVREGRDGYWGWVTIDRNRFPGDLSVFPWPNKEEAERILVLMRTGRQYRPTRYGYPPEDAGLPAPYGE